MVSPSPASSDPLPVSAPERGSSPQPVEPTDHVAILLPLPPDVRRQVILKMQPLTFHFGDVIVREGDEADSFYVLRAGRARVVKGSEGDGEIVLNTLRAGDSFGEAALLKAERRSATVRAIDDVTVLRLAKEDLQSLLPSHPGLEDYFRMQAQHRALHNFMREFSALGRVPLPALRTLLQGVEVREVAQGETVVRQGDPPGPMYVVETGRLRVHVEEGGEERNLNFLRAGDFFGERSLLQNLPRAASVEAVTPVRLLGIRPETFHDLARDYPEFKRVMEERVASYEYERTARVPLDFSLELLPSAAQTGPAVSPGQVEAPQDGKAQAEEPFEDEAGRFVRTKKRIGRFAFLYQIDEADCGAAALGMVCRHFGRRVSLNRIRELAHTSTDGTSLSAICRAAEELGLAARAVKVSLRNLDRMPVPAIVHWDGNHWVVLLDTTTAKVRVADPALGVRWVPREEFERKWSGYAALFEFTEAFLQAPEGKPGVAWIRPFLKPYRGVIAQALVLALVASGLQLLPPIFTQVIVDKVVVERDLALLNLMMGGMVGVLALLVVGMFVQRYLLCYIAVRIDAATLDLLVRRLLALPLSYFTTRRTGDIQRRLDGARQIREFVVQSGIGGVLAVVQIAVTALIMATYSLRLSALFLAMAPLYLGLMAVSARLLRPVFDRLEEGYGKYRSHQVDAIKGIEAVKASGAEAGFRDRMIGEFMKVSSHQFRADLTALLYDGMVQALGFLTTVLFLWMGARMVVHAELSIGEMIAFCTLVAMVNASLLTLFGLWDRLQLASILVNRLNDIFEAEPEQGADRTRLLPVKTLEGRIEFQQAGFRYGGPEATPILKGVTFTVSPRARVAIVGRSGSGKTTLVKCVAGLLETTEGKIRLDGVDLKTLNYRDVRRHVGMVLQENYVFSGTIAENVAFGDPQPDYDRILWAARVANAHEFVARLPLGYETRIGETGVALSGGQRQRVAIARAVYHDPPILVFDEATSALDTESERAIQENMERFLGGRTVLLVAHRLSTVRDADMIVVLENGEVAEHGTHDELMARRGLYFYLVSQQLGM